MTLLNNIEDEVEDEVEDEESGDDFGFGDEAMCCECGKWSSYDDCVHYTEFAYLCADCGEGIDDVCIDCYDRECKLCDVGDDIFIYKCCITNEEDND